jgi:hypothetical protein
MNGRVAAVRTNCRDADIILARQMGPKPAVGMSMTGRHRL